MIKGSILQGSIGDIGNQFINETMKRDICRQKCEEKGCTHFLGMDCDEFYRHDQLEWYNHF